LKKKKWNLPKKISPELGKKVGLFNEVMCIPGIFQDDAMEAVKKLARDSSLLPIFYQCPEEWKKNFIMKLIHPNASSSFMG